MDPGFHTEITSIFRNQTNAVDDILSGYGDVSLINNSAEFCAGGLDTCETGAANGNTVGAGAVGNEYFDTDTRTAAYGSPTDFLFGSESYYSNPPHADECAAKNLTSLLSGNASWRGHAIPEPGTLVLMGLGLLGLAAAGRRRRL